jgi:hypothetical protein
MRMAVSFLAFLVPLAGTAIGAPETGETVPAGPPVQKTIVRGTVPADLPGRWMAVGWVELPGDRDRTVPSLWEVTRENGQPVLTVRFAQLPPELTKALADANNAEKKWVPQPGDLARLAAAWDSLPTVDVDMVSVDNEIVGRDAFDGSFKREPKTTDAAWAIRQSERFHPRAGGAMQTINVYGVLESRDGGYSGNFTTATIAAAPLPIPITLNGTFQMYRIAGGETGESGGFFARLMNTLRGCGRR